MILHPLRDIPPGSFSRSASPTRRIRPTKPVQCISTLSTRLGVDVLRSTTFTESSFLLLVQVLNTTATHLAVSVSGGRTVFFVAPEVKLIFGLRFPTLRTCLHGT